MKRVPEFQVPALPGVPMIFSTPPFFLQCIMNLVGGAIEIAVVNVSDVFLMFILISRFDITCKTRKRKPRVGVNFTKMLMKLPNDENKMSKYVNNLVVTWYFYILNAFIPFVRPK